MAAPVERKGKSIDTHKTDGNDKQATRSVAVELFCLSLSALFFELLVIRWLSCNFVSFHVFKTFPLVTCFVGLGVGVSLADTKTFRYTPIALLLFVSVVQAMSFINFGFMSFPTAGLYQWTNFDALYANQLTLLIFAMAQAIMLLLVGPLAVMICLGARIGALFNMLKPLNAYCIDIGGAILGGILFGLLSFFYLSPNIQLAVVSMVILYYLIPHARPLAPAVITLLLAVGMAFLPLPQDQTARWTPYYRVNVEEILVPRAALVGTEAKASGASSASGGPQHEQTEAKASGARKLGAYINANNNFSQVLTTTNQIELDPGYLEKCEQPVRKTLTTLKSFLDVRGNYYKLPYTLIKPEEVLILGAGSGSDVLEATRNGVERIDAVEIDPLIIQIGRSLNPAYKMVRDKVNVMCNDGRNYLNRCKKKYDMILFACLDSVAVNGQGSSVRTDSYIHTMESYRQALSLLKPDGLFILSFGASVSGDSEWLRNKIYKTISSAAGYSPMVITDENAPEGHKWPAYIFVVGEPVKRGEIKGPVSKDSFTTVDMPAKVDSRILTDDWPYLYIRPTVKFDLPYLAVLLEIILITLFAARRLVFKPGKTGSDGQLFFLGAGFILLELQSISRLSLLYGTTWLTTSIVINGVLIMILLANLLIIKTGAPRRQDLLYAGLAAGLLLSFLLPVENILQLNDAAPYLGHALVTLLTLLPMFMASLVFASAFIAVAVPSTSFAFNLLGTVAGALLEYLSSFWGVNAMVLVAFVLYLLSYLGYRMHCKSSPATPGHKAEKNNERELDGETAEKQDNARNDQSSTETG